MENPSKFGVFCQLLALKKQYLASRPGTCNGDSNMCIHVSSTLQILAELRKGRKGANLLM